MWVIKDMERILFEFITWLEYYLNEMFEKGYLKNMLPNLDKCYFVLCFIFE